MTFAELQERVGDPRVVDDPKEYALSLWNRGRRRAKSGEFIKYRVYLIVEMEDHQDPPLPPHELIHQIGVIPGNWVENLKILERYISVCDEAKHDASLSAT